MRRASTLRGRRSGSSAGGSEASYGLAQATKRSMRGAGGSTCSTTASPFRTHTGPRGPSGASAAFGASKRTSPRVSRSWTCAGGSDATSTRTQVSAASAWTSVRSPAVSGATTSPRDTSCIPRASAGARAARVSRGGSSTGGGEASWSALPPSGDTAEEAGGGVGEAAGGADAQEAAIASATKARRIALRRAAGCSSPRRRGRASPPSRWRRRGALRPGPSGSSPGTPRRGR